jgi:hypothetical protein
MGINGEPHDSILHDVLERFASVTVEDFDSVLDELDTTGFFGSGLVTSITAKLYHTSGVVETTTVAYPVMPQRIFFNGRWFTQYGYNGARDALTITNLGGGVYTAEANYEEE